MAVLIPAVAAGSPSSAPQPPRRRGQNYDTARCVRRKSARTFAIGSGAARSGAAVVRSFEMAHVREARLRLPDRARGAGRCRRARAPSAVRRAPRAVLPTDATAAPTSPQGAPMNTTRHFPREIAGLPASPADGDRRTGRRRALRAAHRAGDQAHRRRDRAHAGLQRIDSRADAARAPGLGDRGRRGQRGRP